MDFCEPHHPPRWQDGRDDHLVPWADSLPWILQLLSLNQGKKMAFFNRVKQTGHGDWDMSENNVLLMR